MNKINETFDRGNYPADMSIGDGSKTVPVSIRPNTGNATGSKLTKKRKQGVSRPSKVVKQKLPQVAVGRH